MMESARRSVIGVPSPAQHLQTVRVWLALFMVGLVLSGLTAFPLAHEIAWLNRALHAPAVRGFAESMHLLTWMERVDRGWQDTTENYPFLAYGTDWLAFAHLVIAAAFIGPWIDPVRNKGVITFGLIACAGVIPLAVIAGAVRGIPWGWRLIDCSFGVIGCLPLLACRRHIRDLEAMEKA
jgi:hypothetical protein